MRYSQGLRIGRRTVLAGGIGAAAWIGLGLDGRPVLANEVYDELTKKGATIGAGQYKLPPPTMADGLTAKEQLAAIAGIPNRSHNVEDLLRDSVVAPHEIQIGMVEKKDGDGKIRTLDVWFVAYGKLKDMATQAFMKQVGGPGGGKSQELTEGDLKDRKIQLAAPGGATERYLHVVTDLFDKVRINGTNRTLETRKESSITFAGMLDRRFDSDDKFPNHWQKLVDKQVEGKPQSYGGVASYVKATELLDPKGAVFIEYHVVFDEPQGWFDGANLIASKLPPIVQTNLQTVRRKAKAPPPAGN